jgi:hypothetical protein
MRSAGRRRAGTFFRYFTSVRMRDAREWRYW